MLCAAVVPLKRTTSRSRVGSKPCGSTLTNVHRSRNGNLGRVVHRNYNLVRSSTTEVIGLGKGDCLRVLGSINQRIARCSRTPRRNTLMLFQNVGKSNLRSLADCEVFLQLYVETSVYYDTRVISGADQSTEVIVIFDLEDVLHLINSRVVGTIESSTQNGQGISVCIARRHLIVLAVVSAARKSKIDNSSAAHSIFVFHVLVVRNHNIGHINRIIHSSRIPNLKLVSVISHNGILAEKPCRTFLSSYIYRNNSVYIGSNLHHWSRVIKSRPFLPLHAIAVKLSARFDTPSLVLSAPNAVVVA